MLVASCKSGPEHFSIEATYVAARTGARVLVYATGEAPTRSALATTASAVAVVCPTTKVGRPVELEVAPPNASPRTVKLTGLAAPATLSWAAPEREASLSRVFSSAGYGTPDVAELAELPDAINSVARGPNGVRIAGQTRVLVVEPVDFEARHSPTLASCSSP